MSATTVLTEPVVPSDKGEGAIGNLKSEKAGDGTFGEIRESIFGVVGAVATPEGRWNGDSRPGG